MPASGGGYAAVFLAGLGQISRYGRVGKHLLENLTGLEWPWGLKGNIGFRPLSELPQEYAALGKFLADQDGIWRLRKLEKDKIEEAKSGYLPEFHMLREMEKAERRRNGLAVMPLLFRAFSFTAIPAATSLQGEGHDARSVRQALKHLVSFSTCRRVFLQRTAGHVELITRAALAGNFREAAIQALAAAIPLFQETANVLRDFHEFCDALDDSLYLSFLPRFRLEALLEQARDAPKEKRRKFYGRLPVVQSAFMSMTRMQAILCLCTMYCARHKMEFPHEDSLGAFSAMSEEERRPAKLAASLAAALKEETAVEATTSHLPLLERKERILATLPPEP